MTTRSLPVAQQFYQQVIQKYGWFSKYDDTTNENGYWSLEIIVGLKEKWIILKSEEQDFKVAKTILSSKAMELLQQDIAEQEAKPLQSLSEVFPNPLVIYDSSDENTWKRFWESKPSVVGVDVEGNQKTPPVLVQISTDEYTILEVPKDKLSDDLVRLLEDDSITKIFCDNGSHKDKKCLGVWKSDDNSSSNDLLHPPIIDLEVVFGSFAGPVKAARGLSKILAMCLHQPPLAEASGGFSEVLNVRIGKPASANQRMKNVGRFALIEQGKQKPLKGLKDLKEKEKQYAALDSWCTLQTYHRLRALEKRNDRINEPTTIKVEGNNEAVESSTADSHEKEGKPALDKDSKEWLLQENKRLSAELIRKEKQLKDAQRQIEVLENKVKNLQPKGTGSGPRPGRGNQGKKGGGRGGRGNNNRKNNRQPNQKKNQQKQEQEAK